MTLIAQTPYIYNVTLTLANTEYSQALPRGTKRFTISERGGNPFRLAFSTGLVAAPTEPYETVMANQVYWEQDLYLVGVMVYFAAPILGRVIEIVAWV